MTTTTEIKIECPLENIAFGHAHQESSDRGFTTTVFFNSTINNSWWTVNLSEDLTETEPVVKEWSYRGNSEAKIIINELLVAEALRIRNLLWPTDIKDVLIKLLKAQAQLAAIRTTLEG